MQQNLTIRALMQIDRLPPKFAAYNGATVQGCIPLAGATVLLGLLVLYLLVGAFGALMIAAGQTADRPPA